MRNLQGLEAALPLEEEEEDEPATVFVGPCLTFEIIKQTSDLKLGRCCVNIAIIRDTLRHRSCHLAPQDQVHAKTCEVMMSKEAGLGSLNPLTHMLFTPLLIPLYPLLKLPITSCNMSPCMFKYVGGIHQAINNIGLQEVQN